MNEKKIVLFINLIFLIILAINSISQNNITFSNYPDFFVKEDYIDVSIVVGQNAHFYDQITATDIFSILTKYHYIKKGIYKGITETGSLDINVKEGLKYTHEVSYNNTNNIIVGGPCVNEFAALLLNHSTRWPECAIGFNKGKARIEIYERWGKTKILVAGMTKEDTKMAGEILVNYYKYNLTGKKIEVIGDLSNISIRTIK